MLLERVVKNVKEILVIDSESENHKAVFVWGTYKAHVFQFKDKQMKEPKQIEVRIDHWEKQIIENKDAVITCSK